MSEPWQKRLRSIPGHCQPERRKSANSAVAKLWRKGRQPPCRQNRRGTATLPARPIESGLRPEGRAEARDRAPRDPIDPRQNCFAPFGRLACRNVKWLRCSQAARLGHLPCFHPPLHMSMLYTLPPHTGTRFAGPPVRVPAASRLAHRPIRRPGPDVYNSVMCPVGLLHCHRACYPALAPGREPSPAPARRHPSRQPPRTARLTQSGAGIRK